MTKQILLTQSSPVICGRSVWRKLMAQIEITKKYLVNTNRGNYRIYISKHGDGNWYAGVLWYEKAGNWSSGQDVNLKMNLESFVNTTEQLVFDESENWVKTNLDSDAKISQEN